MIAHGLRCLSCMPPTPGSISESYDSPHPTPNTAAHRAKSCPIPKHCPLSTAAHKARSSPIPRHCRCYTTPCSPLILKWELGFCLKVIDCTSSRDLGSRGGMLKDLTNSVGQSGTNRWAGKLTKKGLSGPMWI